MLLSPENPQKHRKVRSNHWFPTQPINPHWPHVNCQRLAPKNHKRSKVQSIHWFPTQAINPHWPHEDCPRLGQKTQKKQGWIKPLVSNTAHQPNTAPCGLPAAYPKKHKRSEVISIHWSPTQASNPHWPNVDCQRLTQKTQKKQGYINPLVPNTGHQPTLAP